MFSTAEHRQLIDPQVPPRGTKVALLASPTRPYNQAHGRATLMRTFIGMRVLALFALAFLAVSCGRSLPTAATPNVRHEPGEGGDPFAVAGLENQVVVTIAPGVNPTDFAAQYGATIVDMDPSGRTASLRPLPGTITPTALMGALTIDGRCETAEPNGWFQPAESR